MKNGCLLSSWSMYCMCIRNQIHDDVKGRIPSCSDKRPLKDPFKKSKTKIF